MVDLLADAAEGGAGVMFRLEGQPDADDFEGVCEEYTCYSGKRARD